jgi:hypothetical protein
LYSATAWGTRGSSVDDPSTSLAMPLPEALPEPLPEPDGQLALAESLAAPDAEAEPDALPDPEAPAEPEAQSPVLRTSAPSSSLQAAATRPSARTGAMTVMIR